MNATNQHDVEPNPNQGIISWFAHNPVAANLLMGFIIITGLATALFSLNKQMFPQLEFNSININAAYPGASPKDVEENITIRIEEALEGIQGLERVVTFSRRNAFNAYIRIEEGYQLQTVLDEIKVQIDGIPSFPEGMERPIVTANKFRQEVQYVTLYGDVDDRQLKEIGEDIYREIQAIPEVQVSNYFSGLKYEISIEISKEKLREYNLSFQDVAQAVRNHSTNMTAGQIKAIDGYITLRSENQAYRGTEFSHIPIRNLANGSQVKLSDVAVIRDDFEDGIQYTRFNGKNARTFFIGASPSQSITDIAQKVNAYIAQKNMALPEELQLKAWIDMTYYLEGRLNMMLENMLYGSILVFLILALFLQFRLAFWVMLGLPIAFLGALMLLPLPWINVTINVTSLFGFIMVLGIVVDDAIVIGESVNAEIEEKGHTLKNVIRGAQRVAMPATFGVLTTVAAFAPMLFATGPDGAMSKAIGSVVILCLLFSLVESKLILPAHLAGMKSPSAKATEQPTNYKRINPLRFIPELRLAVDRNLKQFIQQKYTPLLETAIRYRYLVFAIFIALILISAGLFRGQVVRSVGFPKIPHDFPQIKIEMNESSPEADTLNTALTVEKILMRTDHQLMEQYGGKMIDEIMVDLRTRTLAQITVKLVEPENRPMDTFKLAELWRENMPDLPGVKNFTINDSLFGNEQEDGDIGFKLTGHNYEALSEAVDIIKQRLSTLSGIGKVNDSRDTQVKEVQFDLKPVAYGLGLTPRDVASQMQFSLYGLEAQRILRNNEEIKVMLRYPEAQRNSPGIVDDILIRTSHGAELPLAELADIRHVDGVNQIRRENGTRSISIWAEIDEAIISSAEVRKMMNTDIFPEVSKRYPSIKLDVSGKLKREMQRSRDQIRDLIITLLAVYILLAIPLKSYAQPFIILSVIPFGVVGAIIGHIIFNINLSTLSVFGIIAASGVVINDSLVMVDYINKAKLRGLSLYQSVVEAGSRRFRAITLTSLTTFIGLIPIILETSMQAKIVIPMAISLAFGVLFATVVTLFFVPCLYLIASDIKGLIRSSIFRYKRVTEAI